MIHYVTGDATLPVVEDGIRVIAHIVNDIGAWGAGFSGALSKRYPEIEEYYRKRYQYYRSEVKLGKILWRYVSGVENLTTCNLVAQHGLRSPSNPVAIRYDALDTALDEMAEGGRGLVGDEAHMWNLNKVTFHMPRIGTGLAGGKWNRIGPLIEDHLWDFDVYVYDLP